MAERTTPSMASRSTNPVLRQPWKTTCRSCSTSRAISDWIACAVFFLRRERLFHRTRAADSFVHRQQRLAELPKAMERIHLALRLAQCGRRGKAFADGFSVFLAGQAEVRTVTRLAGLMTMAIRFSTTALDGGDGATAKVTEMENLRQDLGTLLFEGGEGIGQGAPPIRTYSYVRIIKPKKKTSKSSLLCRAPEPRCTLNIASP